MVSQRSPKPFFQVRILVALQITKSDLQKEPLPIKSYKNCVHKVNM